MTWWGPPGRLVLRGAWGSHKRVCSSRITLTSQNGSHFSLLGHFCG